MGFIFCSSKKITPCFPMIIKSDWFIWLPSCLLTKSNNFMLKFPQRPFSEAIIIIKFSYDIFRSVSVSLEVDSAMGDFE